MESPCAYSLIPLRASAGRSELRRLTDHYVGLARSAGRKPEDGLVLR